MGRAFILTEIFRPELNGSMRGAGAVSGKFLVIGGGVSIGCLLLAGVLLTSFPGQTKLSNWTYPQATNLQMVSGVVTGGLYVTADSFSNVFGHFEKRTPLSRGGEPAFMSSSGAKVPFFGPRQMAVAKIGTGDRPLARAMTILYRTKTDLFLAHFTAAGSNGPTSLVVAGLPVSRKAASVRAGLDRFAYPDAKRSAGGSGGPLTAYRYTSPDPLKAVLEYYLKKLNPGQTGHPKSSTEGAPTILNAESGRWMVLPTLVRPELEERVLLWLEPKRIVSVHLTRGADEDKTHIILSGSTR